MPITLNSTVNTSPFFPDGKSPGARCAEAADLQPASPNLFSCSPNLEPGREQNPAGLDRGFVCNDCIQYSGDRECRANRDKLLRQQHSDWQGSARWPGWGCSQEC